MPKSLRLKPTGFVFRWTPLLVARALRRRARVYYLDRFWEAHRARKPHYQGFSKWPTSEEYQRIKRATQLYTERVDGLTYAWQAVEYRLKALEVWSIRRALRLRHQGKI